MRYAAIFSLGLFVGAAACQPPVIEPERKQPAADDKGDKPSSPPTPPTTPSAPETCGAQTFPISVTSVPPNVYLLVDRSGSMSDSFGNGVAGTKWDAAQNALTNLLVANTGKARWGMSLFPPNPSVDQCGKAIVDVPLGAGTESNIMGRINALSNSILANPRGSTPTADALKTVRDLANLDALDRNNYAVLVTDGIPQCNSAADAGAVIAELYDRSPSVKTFVVGIGDETASNPSLLNDWADKGHTARPDPARKYYQANNASQLASAFDEIIGKTTSCVFALQSAPPDPALLAAQLDGTALANDPANGFTYDSATQSVVFHGSACDKITQGQVQSVGVVYGCPPPPIL